MIPISAVREARARIGEHIVRTPLTRDAERRLCLKWENHQTTGSFKLRGALNKVLGQAEAARERGVVAASAGNHGQGVAYAARLVSAHARVFTYAHAVPEKVAAMRALGAEVVAVDGGYGDAEAAALSNARESGRLWISPYNDHLVMAGQGTIALEVIEDLETPGEVTVWMPAGGGGLAAGIGSVVRSLRPGWRVIAAQSCASAFLHAHFRGSNMGAVIEKESLADGLSGPVEPGSKTLDLVREVLDDFVLVEEAAIERAIGEAWWLYGERIEGSAAVALAAARQHGAAHGGTQVVIISGGNLSPNLHTEICARWGSAEVRRS